VLVTDNLPQRFTPQVTLKYHNDFRKLPAKSEKKPP
jgi:hypothetical protein